MMDTSLPEFESQLATAIHEVTHAMVFSSSLYPWFRDSNGAPRTARESDGKPPAASYTPEAGCSAAGQYQVNTDMLSSETRRGKLVWIMKTPAVLAAARAHFACSTLTGMELENQPTTDCSTDRPASHWEHRIMIGDFMSPQAHHDSAYSAITLGLFQDSGWYTVDTTAATPMHWGKDNGVLFRDRQVLDTRG